VEEKKKINFIEFPSQKAKEFILKPLDSKKLSLNNYKRSNIKIDTIIKEGPFENDTPLLLKSLVYSKDEKEVFRIKYHFKDHFKSSLLSHRINKPRTKLLFLETTGQNALLNLNVKIGGSVLVLEELLSTKLHSVINTLYYKSDENEVYKVVIEIENQKIKSLIISLNYHQKGELIPAYKF
jgi:hypothetical protein